MSLTQTRLGLRTDDFVEVTRRWPLWASIPSDLRVTEEDVTDGVRAEHYRALVVERLRNPQCVVAVHWQRRPALYKPCAGQVWAGADLCVEHGGPGKPPEESLVSRLRAERDELVAEVQRIRAASREVAS